MQGQIIGNKSNLYKVKYEDNYILCKARGKFKNENLKPLVGDRVLFDIDKQMIMTLLPRKNELIRPPICNVDQALIVMSVKEPSFDDYLLDKMINIIHYHKIDVIICLTKLDLLNQNERETIDTYIDYYCSLGYSVVINTDLDKLKALLKNKVTTVTGQSGVGKSSLLNKLDNRLNLKTNGISIALGRGKHTTKHVELIAIGDALIADTPGFSSLSFNKMTKEDIRDGMLEFSMYKDDCKYRDCFHLKEDDCQIKKMVDKNIVLKSRYNNYQKFIKESEVDYGKNIRFHSKQGR